MVRKAAQEPKDDTLQMKVRQYVVSAARLPIEQGTKPEILQMRVFARDEVHAKTKFWYNMRKLNKIKRSQGRILSVNEIYEKSLNTVKTYGIVLKYQSRTAIHNMYKEYRDVSLNGAVSQLIQDMAGNHRAQPDTIQIIRTATLEPKDIKRPATLAMRNAALKFPIVKTIHRPSEKKYRTVYKATRPTTFQ
ncbi:60S ribosomal protein L18a (macronuclear) [Tetrahymena thermophila SB210]|nr:60S ribosomal protein L18a [Tetrahymena thermophila SB210]EAR97130.3 60S ribosomal protein L18a [Tetrahymena thermophila SB210]|eukprot:XP_001017375.3 60S ribosomal protein L18a [Tetrahymena thermophila SB210]